MRIRLKHERLREAIARRRLTQNAWALRLGLSSGHFSRLVNGKRPYPNAATRERLLKGFDLSFEELFSIDTTPSVRSRSIRLKAASRGKLSRSSQSISAPQGGISLLSQFLSDLKFARRMLSKSPSLAFSIIAALSLSIGANTAIFSIVDNVLLKALPYPEADRLTIVEQATRQGETRPTSSLETFAAWQEATRSFQGLAAVGFVSYNLTGAASPEQLRAALVSPLFFEVMGVAPALGRSFDAQEVKQSPPAAVVLNHQLWVRQFGSDAKIIGQGIMLDGRSYTVVGVMPEGFDFPGYDMWIPLGDGGTRAGGALALHPVVGRLRRGIDLKEAQSEMDLIALRLAESRPAGEDALGIRLISLHERTVGDTRASLLALLGAAGFVLMIACVNVANLMLTRGASRRREMAVRLALGAAPGRLARQLLTESLLWAGLGGLGGLVLAWLAIRVIPSLAPQDLPRLDQVALDYRVGLFVFLITVVTGIAFGLFPAWAAARSSDQSALRGSRRSSPAIGIRLRGALVVTETALAMLLLVGAGLMAKSLLKLNRVDPGFNPQILTLGMALPQDRYTDRESVRGFYRKVVERVSGLGRVESVAACNFLPLMGGPSPEVWTDGLNPPPDPLQAFQRVVTPGFFQTFEIPFVSGRRFEWSDDQNQARVVIVNRTAARRLWPEIANPSDRTLRVAVRGGAVEMRVVGVVEDIRAHGLQGEIGPEIFTPHSQSAWSYMNLVVRGSVDDPLILLPDVQQVIWDLDPERPIFSITSMQMTLDRLSLAQPRFRAFVTGAFALFALLLCLVGIHGVTSFAVTSRRAEIGTRLALGALRGDILRMVLGRGVVLAVFGIGLGCAAAWALRRTVSNLLFAVDPLDGGVYLICALFLVLAAGLASFFPARRAAAVDPAAVLRD